MGWPYDGGLWRDNAKPAQEQYANVAKAISEFEPLVMFADPEVCPPWMLLLCILQKLASHTLEFG